MNKESFFSKISCSLNVAIFQLMIIFTSFATPSAWNYCFWTKNLLHAGWPPENLTSYQPRTLSLLRGQTTRNSLHHHGRFVLVKRDYLCKILQIWKKKKYLSCVFKREVIFFLWVVLDGTWQIFDMTTIDFKSKENNLSTGGKSPSRFFFEKVPFSQASSSEKINWRIGIG